ncbi:Ig-like domain-containing protein [Algoriphagus aquatilis]|uniref:Ig-like domain-containing protein n=1 Tax=Algoriphagus aquatilis TaxID=490186 RepID=A0ABW0BUD5_9BACT
MRTFKTNLLGMALAGLILSACSQTGMYETADLMNEQAEASKSGFRLDPFGVGNENALTLAGGGNWETDCITASSGSIYKATGDLTATFGNQNNPGTKTLNVEVWNTPTTIEYRFTLSSSNANGNNLQFFDETATNQENPTGTWVSVGQLTVGTPFVVSRPLPTGWVAGQFITEQWRQTGGGNPLDAGDVSYALIGICTTTSLSAGTTEPICENASFSLTATVSTSAETLTGGFIQILNSSNVVVASADVTSTVRSVTYNVPTGTAGNYTYSAQYVRSTPSFRYQGSVSSTTSTVNVIECGGCDENFTYSVNGDEVTFTYIPAEDVTGANLAFTFPQSALDTPLQGWTYSGQTMQRTMDLKACETYTWKVTLTCKPLNNPQNKWTDFKVNGVSKKGSLNNIDC